MTGQLKALMACVVLVAAWSIAPQVEAKWAGGLILLPAPGVLVDGVAHEHGPLKGTEVIASAKTEARLFVMGPSGKALAVLAPGSEVALSGTLAGGYDLDLRSGAVRVVRSGGKGKALQVKVGTKIVDLPAAGGVVVLDGSVNKSTVLELGSDGAKKLFASDAPSVLGQLGMPVTGLPVIAPSGEKQAGEMGDGAGGGAQVEGESMCLDSAGAGPEGTDPTTDTGTGVEIDRTKTSIKLKVTW